MEPQEPTIEELAVLAALVKRLGVAETLRCVIDTGEACGVDGPILAVLRHMLIDQATQE